MNFVPLRKVFRPGYVFTKYMTIIIMNYSKCSNGPVVNSFGMRSQCFWFGSWKTHIMHTSPISIIFVLYCSYFLGISCSCLLMYTII